MRPFLFTNGDLLKQSDALCEEVKQLYEFIVMGLYDYRTNRELEEAKQFWQDQLKGVDLKFSTISPFGTQKATSMGIPRALVPSDARMAVPDLTYGHAPCHRPLMRMIIRYDGEMCNCCEDVRGAFGLGNIYRDSLKDLWLSNRHTEIIESLLAG